MALEKITEQELAGRGLALLPDVPGLPAEEMKQKFEEVVKEVVIPAFNRNVEESYSRDEVDHQINRAVFESGASDMNSVVYDPLKTVAAAGGIGSAIENSIAQNGKGVQRYTHEKVGTVHRLTGPAGDDIQFKAAADFLAGDSFEVNGVACGGYGEDAAPVQELVFAQNALVSCVLDGDRLVFRRGGRPWLKLLWSGAAAAGQVIPLPGAGRYGTGQLAAQVASSRATPLHTISTLLVANTCYRATTNLYLFAHGELKATPDGNGLQVMAAVYKVDGDTKEYADSIRAIFEYRI